MNAVVAARFWSVTAFLTLVVAANYLTNACGLIPVGFGLVATAGTWAAGLVLLARDIVQETSGRIAVFACIAVGAGLSAATSSPRLAIASGTAFAISETADFAVYSPLRRTAPVRGRDRLRLLRWDVSRVRAGHQPGSAYRLAPANRSTTAVGAPMIRPSDKGPGRTRPPRTKTARGGGGSGGGGTNKGWSLCPLAIVLPALMMAACTALALHGT